MKTAILDTETRVRAEVNATFEEYRAENRSLYDRLDKLREEHSKVFTENMGLKEEKTNQNERLKKEIEQTEYPKQDSSSEVKQSLLRVIGFVSLLLSN